MKDNGWLKKQIKNMESDDRLHEFCKCLTKTPKPKYHKKHCPVWKNSRIAELEKAMQEFVGIDVDEWEEYELKYLMRRYVSEFKQLLEAK